MIIVILGWILYKLTAPWWIWVLYALWMTVKIEKED